MSRITVIETPTTREATARKRAAGRHSDTRSTAERLSGYVQALSRRRRVLKNLAAIYRDQTSILLVQIEASSTLLLEMRQIVLVAQGYLSRLSPAEMEQLKPWACITKLGSVDYLLTEILLTLDMFKPLCQSVEPQRVQIHMNIRAAYPSLLAAYDDLRAMLVALAVKANSAEKGALV